MNGAPFRESPKSKIDEAISGDAFRRILPVAEWILVAALLGLFIVRAILPAWRTLNTDFPNYYLTAVLRLEHQPVDRAYEWIWFQRQKDHHQIPQGLVGFVPNPPLCAAPMLLLGSLTALAAKRVWIFLNLACLAASLYILRRVTELGGRHLLLIAGLCLLPLRTNFILGQYYVVILFLICLAYFASIRGHRFTSGNLLAAAAWLKLFPAVFIVLFLRKRDWRAIAGLIAGSAVLAIVSILIFGLDMHRVWLLEVLPRAFRGEMIGPYDLQWSSFSSLWHRLFLFEPELNPRPFLSSPALYAVAQALTGTALLFAFLLSTDRPAKKEMRAWEWATFVTLLLLLSSMPSSYHYVVLIFAAIVGVDALVRAGKWRAALLLMLLYAMACTTFSAAGLFGLRRLLATLVLYVVFLWNAPAVADARTRKILWMTGIAVFGALAVLNFGTSKNRDGDFAHRATNLKEGYAAFNPVATTGGVASIEMVNGGYQAVMVADGHRISMPSPGDVLSIAASPGAEFAYFELVNGRSQIVRTPSERISSGQIAEIQISSKQVGRAEAASEFATEGQQPAISYDGRWLAFLRDTQSAIQGADDSKKASLWLSHDGGEPERVESGDRLSILEMSVNNKGEIIAAAGGAASPYFTVLRATNLYATNNAEIALKEIAGAVRYPAVSPESRRLAFSRRESGAWHLFVRELSTGREQRLTDGACNATSPAWEGAHTLLYATDCGRGFGQSAIARIEANN
jgi:hypothetical protein